MRLALPAAVSLLLVGCLPAGDSTPSLPRIARMGLRGDVVGCYAAKRSPPLEVTPRDEWALLAVLELDTVRVYPNETHRWVHLTTGALSQAYSGPKPDKVRRLAAFWRADSLTDSVSIWLSVGWSTIAARVVRRDDGSLQGLGSRASEGVVRTPRDAARLHVLLGQVAWRAVPCRSLSLDRSTALYAK